MIRASEFPIGAKSKYLYVAEIFTKFLPIECLNESSERLKLLECYIFLHFTSKRYVI